MGLVRYHPPYAENAQEIRSADQNLRHLRAAFYLAQGLGQGLGRGALLFR